VCALSLPCAFLAVSFFVGVAFCCFVVPLFRSSLVLFSGGSFFVGVLVSCFVFGVCFVACSFRVVSVGLFVVSLLSVARLLF